VEGKISVYSHECVLGVRDESLFPSSNTQSSPRNYGYLYLSILKGISLKCLDDWRLRS
jgi:hypothetical protein